MERIGPNLIWITHSCRSVRARRPHVTSAIKPDPKLVELTH